MPQKNDQNQIIGIFFADPHFSHIAPSLRCEEQDWLVSMERVIKEIGKIQARHKCPMFCAGDIFDKWNSPPHLINKLYEMLNSYFTEPI